MDEEDKKNVVLMVYAKSTFSKDQLMQSAKDKLDLLHKYDEMGKEYCTVNGESPRSFTS